MAVAGANLPVIPSVLFPLLSARHAVRISSKLDEFLRGQPWLAALRDLAEAHENLLRLDRRSLVKMLVFTAVAAPVLVIFHPPLPVMIGLELGVVAVICIRALGRPGDPEIALGVPVKI
jgi:uncharacterized membrane protein YbaN (DUF454 family)